MQILRLFKDSSLFILPCLLTTTYIAGLAQADIIVNGDVAPDDPSSWTDATAAYIGESSEGSLSITSGDSVTNSLAYVGYDAASSGAVTVDGAGSTWKNTYVLDGRTITGNELYLGYLGTGSLTITNGGTVPYLSAYIGYGAGSTGTVRVNGSNFTTLTDTNVRLPSSLLHVGSAGKGILTITDGGTVSGTSTHIGYEAEAEGFVTVDGETTTLSAKELYIGENGTGVVNVMNGGSVTGTTSYIGANAGSTGTVRVQGTDSTWTNSSNVYIGDNGTGTVRITSGGAVSAGNTSLGTASDASGILTIDGEETTLNLGSCIIGENGKGVLSITNGATATAGDVSIGLAADASGTVTVDGADSSWDLDDELTIGESGKGTLSVSNGATVSNSSAYIAQDVGSTGDVTIEGTDSSWTNTYSLFLGAGGTGSLTISDGAEASVSQKAYVGENGTGTLKLSNSATMSVNNDVYIGYGAGAQGVVSITNDSVLTSAYNAYIGYSADSSGTVNLNGSEGACGWIIQKSLFIGKEGQGTLNITDGGGVASGGEIYLGYTSGSAGEVKISGTDTGLLTDSSLYVGYNGTGTLSLTNGATATAGKIFIRTGTMSLTNGATVTTDTAYMANGGTAIIDGTDSSWTSSGLHSYVPSTLTVLNGGHMTVEGVTDMSGTVRVSGEGSQWDDDSFTVGSYTSSGCTAITDRGLVRATISASISSGSTLIINVDSSLEIGSLEEGGILGNYGIIRTVAGSGATTGTFTPITWDRTYGDGTIQALGGVWDNDARTVTVAGAITAQGSGGASVTLDLSAKQRVVITDNSSGMSAGIGFPATETSTSLTPTITAIDTDTLTALKSLLTDNEETIVSAWNFTIPTDKYTVSETSPVYLSLYANSPADLASLSIWQLSDGQWSKYSAADLTPDGAFASFTATAAGSYAVTTTNSTSSSSTGSSSKAMPWIPLLLLGD